MRNEREHPGSASINRTFVRVAFPFFFLTVGVGIADLPHRAWAQSPATLSVPAEFMHGLDMPGAQEHFLRPSAIFVDDGFREVLVADAGHNRIVIFDDKGSYRFEFSGRDVFSVPLDVVVDDLGSIIVLGSTPGGRRLFRFDFDGLFLGELALETPGDAVFDPRSLDLAPDGTLLVVDGAGPRVLLYTENGALSSAFDVHDGLGRPITREEVVGRALVRDGHVFVPLPSRGSIYVYDVDGTFVRAIGRKGTNIGELSFPVDVAVTREGLVLILDKNRYNVGCFDLAGRFLGEFGGRGARPGWYYHPTVLAMDPNDHVYIGQVFQNRVDVCRLPDFIKERHLGIKPEVAKSLDQSTQSEKASVSDGMRSGG